MDDDKVREIIESLPEKRSRSRLEPYRQLIAELRRVRRTYREIAHILGERCQVQVSAAAVHNFVRHHLRRKPDRTRRQVSGFHAASRLGATVMNQQPVTPPRKRVTTPSVLDEEVRRRIETLKRQPVPVEATPPLFHYDPNEPLHLLPKPEKN